jgi:hypothetical protein
MGKYGIVLPSRFGRSVFADKTDPYKLVDK